MIADITGIPKKIITSNELVFMVGECQKLVALVFEQFLLHTICIAALQIIQILDLSAEQYLTVRDRCLLLVIISFIRQIIGFECWEIKIEIYILCNGFIISQHLQSYQLSFGLSSVEIQGKFVIVYWTFQRKLIVRKINKMKQVNEIFQRQHELALSQLLFLIR